MYKNRSGHFTGQLYQNGTKQYLDSLPKELKQWYVYSYPKGHCIKVLPPLLNSNKSDNEPLEDFLVSIPVKTVLKGYKIDPNGLVLVEGLEYNPDLGEIIPHSDIEYEEDRPKFNSERLRVQRNRIIKSIAMHCANIRYKLLGKKSSNTLNPDLHNDSYTGFMNIVDAHLNLAENKPHLQDYCTEIETLLSYYEMRISSNNHETFDSDQSGKIFIKHYKIILKSLINKTIQL